MNKIIRKGHITSIVQSTGLISVWVEEAASTKTIAQVFVSIDEAAGLQFGQPVKLTVEPA